MADWSSEQLTDLAAEEEQRLRTHLRLQLPGQVGFGHRWLARMWLVELRGAEGLS